MSRAVDHQKKEMYVQLLFLPDPQTNQAPSEDHEAREARERGPFPVSTVWVPTYQKGVLRGGKLCDDGKRSWRPDGADLPANRDSFARLERCSLPLVRSGGPGRHPCVFYAFADKLHPNEWVMWGVPAPTRSDNKKMGDAASLEVTLAKAEVTLLWDKLLSKLGSGGERLATARFQLEDQMGGQELQQVEAYVKRGVRLWLIVAMQTRKVTMNRATKALREAYEKKRAPRQRIDQRDRGKRTAKSQFASKQRDGARVYRRTFIEQQEKDEATSAAQVGVEPLFGEDADTGRVLDPT